MKCGTGCAQQAYEQHAIIQPIGGSPYAGETPDLDVKALCGARRDPSPGHQDRPKIRGITCGPDPRDASLARFDPIALQGFKRAIPGHRDLVRERRKPPPLAAGAPAAHPRVAPIEEACAFDLDVDALLGTSFCEGDQRVPFAVQVCAVLEVKRALETSGGAVG